MPVKVGVKRQSMAYENRKLRLLIDQLKGDRSAAVVDIRPIKGAPKNCGWAELVVTLGGTGDEDQFCMDVASKAFIYWLIYERERLRQTLKVIEDSLDDMGVDVSKIDANREEP